MAASEKLLPQHASITRCWKKRFPPFNLKKGGKRHGTARESLVSISLTTWIVDIRTASTGRMSPRGWMRTANASTSGLHGTGTGTNWRGNWPVSHDRKRSETAKKFADCTIGVKTRECEKKRSPWFRPERPAPNQLPRQRPDARNKNRLAFVQFFVFFPHHHGRLIAPRRTSAAWWHPFPKPQRRR